MGRHNRIDADQPYEHPDLKGETTPNKIKALTDSVAAEEERQRDRVVRERGQTQS